MILKKIMPIMLLFTSINVIAQDSNIEMSLNNPAYGVKIKNNFPGATGGFDRAFRLSNEDGSTNFFGLGAFGTIVNGVSSFGYGYLGTAYDNSYMTFIPNGSIGIGTNTPSNKLEVNGGINATAYYLKNTGTLDYPGSYLHRLRAEDGNFYIDGDIGGSTYAPALTVYRQGNIGIGTSDPKGYKLAVNGKVRAHEIKVETANWPDYVFAKDYLLPALQEIEKHIKDKGHLPGIPSAAEVKANGVDLGEMNAKLLQKIEELTLHLIEKEKQMEIQNDRIKQLELNFQKIRNR